MPDTLLQALLQWTGSQAGSSPFATPIKGLTLLRSDYPKHPAYLIYKPTLCVVVQGAKWAIFGEERMEYRPGQALLVSVEMPGLGYVSEASPSEPYLGIVLELDPVVMREVLETMENPPSASGPVGRGVHLSDFSGPLAESVFRLVRLLDTPEAIPVLYESVMREICYWLLAGPHAAEVVKMTMGSSQAQQVVAAIHSLRDRFAEPVRIVELAAAAGMSVSAFHRQFKAVTAMTPLHYQKQLRLIEARRLLVSEAVNVESAAYRVGYESPSQFSREYTRMFGAAPKRESTAARLPAA